MVKANSGYSLVELMVVLGIVGFLATVVLFASRNFSHGQAVKGAQQGFLSQLRSVQAAVNSGVKGDPYQTVEIPASGKTYFIHSGYDGAGDFTENKIVNLPNEVSFSGPLADITLCFANQNFLNSHPDGFADSSYKCGGCSISPPGEFFACVGGVKQDIGEVEFGFIHSALSGYKPIVAVSGNGIYIDRVYAK